jgi:hypothetical protein
MTIQINVNHSVDYQKANHFHMTYTTLILSWMCFVGLQLPRIRFYVATPTWAAMIIGWILGDWAHNEYCGYALVLSAVPWMWLCLSSFAN